MVGSLIGAVAGGVLSETIGGIAGLASTGVQATVPPTIAATKVLLITLRLKELLNSPLCSGII